MELQQHLQEKETHRKTRRNNALHKQREKLKYLSLHKGADKYKKLASKKGQGKALKEKGRTCPKGVPMNSCGKGWAKIHWEYTEETLKEGFTFTYLWIRT